MTKNKPWITKEFKQMLKRKKMLYKKYLKYTSSDNFRALKSCSKLCNKIKCQLKRQYYFNLLQQSNGDSMKTWSIINSLTKRNNKKTSTIQLTLNDDPIDNPETILNNYFINLASDMQQSFVEDTRWKNYLQNGSLLNKFDDIYDFLRDLNFEIDVLAISENWLNDSNENLIDINGYVFKGKHRRIKHGGRVGFYIKNNLDYKIRDDITSKKNEFEFFVLEIINRPITKNVLIIVTYRPPTYDVNSFIECLDDILLVANHENKLIIVAGDFNIDLSESNNNNKKFNFLQLMNSYSLQQTITIPTRVECNRQSIIDNIFTNIPENILVSGVISHCLSDHQPVFSSINLSKKMFMFPEKRNAPSVKFSYSTNRINNLNQRLSQVNWQVVYESANIEEAFQTFIIIFQECFRERCQSIRMINRVKSFLPKNCLNLLYNSLCIPLINYCNIVWASSYHTSTLPIETLIKRAVVTLDEFLKRTLLWSSCLLPIDIKGREFFFSLFLD
ncbi:hypothetical protein HELRODRAFT_181964 [Helobdella robusta]|uniref:Endonuclease/exonuclease/phosphatase domain-containing protein n=1 Tax=Helobdella robusta TaxID=6412 RepID=T1FHJ0_HELRO|nr:hypothetical protein HELRODRAFT_181964 [Helobdella robusta]ESN91909.1 hypothetical protein HELRODRAFT_181964 [Helobdella robusta]